MTAFVCSFTPVHPTVRCFHVSVRPDNAVKLPHLTWKRCLNVVSMRQVETPTTHVHPSKAPTAKPKLAVDGDSIETSPDQVALLATFVALSLTETVHTVSSVPLNQVIFHLFSAFAAYIFTDFAVGVYHHAVDNYGSADTPIVGCKFISQTNFSR